MVEVCRQLGVRLATFYALKRSMGQMGISKLNELRFFREENGRLKKLAADLTLDKHVLQEGLSKKFKACSLAWFYCIDARILQNECEAYL